MIIVYNNNGNIIAESEKSQDVYFFWDNAERVEFKELKNIEIDQTVIRSFAITKDGCKIQFRAKQPLTTGGKERNLIATAHLSIEDLKYLLQKIQDQKI